MEAQAPHTRVWFESELANFDPANRGRGSVKLKVLIADAYRQHQAANSLDSHTSDRPPLAARSADT